ncbi:MAG: prepilin peptidase [Pirellulaceae bacterium]
MRSRRRRHPNWPYRWTVLGLFGALLLYVAVQTIIGGFTFSRRPYGTDWGLALVSSLLDAIVATWFIAVGASIGSFLNVVAYRLPLGRKLGGNSKCPFCTTPIDGADNIPVLAWIRLRGRCRSCRLPISAQYPLVEFAVAVIFFFVYCTEFLPSGGNLPGVTGNLIGAGGLARISVSSDLVWRLGTYLFALSGLIGAALIALKGAVVPLRLYAWSLLPHLISVLALPQAVIVRWRAAPPVGPIESRLDSFTTVLCGVVAGIALARLLAPLLYKGFDRSLFAHDKETNGARQLVGAMAVAGGIVGWQAIVPLGWVLLVSATTMSLLLGRFRSIARLGDLTSWVWLGLLLFRAIWKPLSGFTLLPDVIPEVGRYLIGALLLAALAIGYRIVSEEEREEIELPIESAADGISEQNSVDEEEGDWDDDEVQPYVDRRSALPEKLNDEPTEQ